ncbi:hypothetical protein FZI91_02425 [Mycobacterium sp. CBMA271]|uniref:hypothetical protein n=1 Tax=unclassified Mycobacteroides TaxID=2618759 RepID=UPI0012DC84ED|nr:MULTISPECIES: hypothetical protein [unclassified Mycobacteroides]MUM20560.1 hypothetical protein [Mycobacteroides sp. CBMA 271]
MTDGRLLVWTGSPCVSVGPLHVSLFFEPSPVELELTGPEGAKAEYLTVGGPYLGLHVAKPIPDGFNWRDSKTMRISVYPNGWGSTTQLATVLNESAQHPDDTYWFQNVGWLNPAEVAAKDGKEFLATCTPDPAKTKKK